MQRIEKNLKDRIVRWSGFRSSIAKRTMLLFNMYLSQKGYSGSLSFDHEAKKLEISVQLDKMRPTEQQQAIHDTKALSGGKFFFSLFLS
jgi:hypothetical protein